MTYLSRSAIASALLLSVSFPALAVEPIEEIIVTASPLGRSADEAITGVSVLTGQDLAGRLAGTLGETLKSEPGVSSTFFGAGASRPIIRGQGGDRVRVLVNGIGSIDASSASPDHAVAAEPAQAERIEVLRGAALLRYGSSGSGGVVNVIDGRIPDRVPDDIDGAVRIGASGVNAGREVAGSVNIPAGQNLVIHAGGTWRKSDDYDIPGFAESAALRAAEEAEHDEEHDEPDHEHEDEAEAEARDRLPNSDVQTRSATFGASFVGERGFIGAAVHQYNSDYGVPGGHEHAHEEGEDHDDEEHDEEEHDEAEEEGDVTIGLKQTRIDINGALDFDGLIERVQVFAGFADYEHTEFEGPGVVGTVFTNEGYEVRGEALQAERGGWSAAYGAQVRRRDFAAIGDEAFVPPTRTDQLGLYTFQEKEIGEFHLEGALRAEFTEQGIAGSGETLDFDTYSVSVGGDYHFNNVLRAGGTVFRTQRAPTTEELFSDGPHLATSQFEKGDAGLDVETATGVEAALRYRSGPIKLTGNIFLTDYSDFIFELPTGETEDGLDVFQYQSDDARFAGFELQGAWHAGSAVGTDFDFDGLIEYVRAETDSGNLPRIPPLSILAGMDAQRGDFTYRAEVEYTAEADDLAASETATGSYMLTNLFATWRPAGAQDVALKLSVHNLFDEEARQHTSFLKDVVPLPGRDLRFAIVSRF